MHPSFASTPISFEEDSSLVLVPTATTVASTDQDPDDDSILASLPPLVVRVRNCVDDGSWDENEDEQLYFPSTLTVVVQESEDENNVILLKPRLSVLGYSLDDDERDDSAQKKDSFDIAAEYVADKEERIFDEEVERVSDEGESVLDEDEMSRSDSTITAVPSFLEHPYDVLMQRTETNWTAEHSGDIQSMKKNLDLSRASRQDKNQETSTVIKSSQILFIARCA